MSPSPTDSSSKDAAIAFASQKCFHQSITLPANSSHQKLRVSFATTSNFGVPRQDGKVLPKILFCGGMGSSRLLLFGLDALAKREGVVVLFIDRPGIGGSTAVRLDQRVKVWMEIVPAVLEYLEIQTVALISHSVGAVYAVNTLLDLPHLLHPETPFAALLTPWIHPTYSSAPLMQVVDRLPSSLVGSLHHIHKFVGGYIAPSIQFSSGMLNFASSDLSEDDCLKTYNMDTRTWEQVGKLQGQWMREEDMSGISEDAKLCMQKDARDWGAYNHLPTAIASLQRVYAKQTRPPLTLEAYFSTTDQMIGKGGQVYFERCWGEGNVDHGIRFGSRVVQGTDHDSIVLTEKGCLETIFKQVKEQSGF